MALVVGCHGAQPEPRLVRLASEDPWPRCTLGGESRPTHACTHAQLLASGRDVPIPASGVVEVSLSTFHPAAQLVIVPEVFTYDAPPADALSAFVLANLAQVLATAKDDRALGQVLAHDTTFRPAPQPRDADASPSVLHFGPASGQRTVYAIWGWSAEPERPFDVALANWHSADQLDVAFGMQDAAWRSAGHTTPVAFAVTATTPAGSTELLRRVLYPVRAESDRGWQEARITLPESLAAPVRLTFAAVDATDGHPAPFAAWARPALRHTSATAPPPNIVLLSLDTLRADHVGAYGAARKATPNLDRVASAGTVFEQVLAAFPSTTASHMTMFTSLEPCAHGVLTQYATLDQHITTLAQALSARGYTTFAVTEDGLIRGEAGFDRGFDSYRDLIGSGMEPLGSFAQVIALARSWLEHGRQEPFFMFLHTYQVHVPYKVPAQYRDLYPFEPDASEARRQEADYDRGLHYADDLFADLLAALDTSPLAEHTLLVVTSDHGTEFGEHGGIGHARGVYEEQLRVPLILRHPTLVARGGRISDLVGLIDLAPTLLEIAGVARPASFVGTSLVPLLAGRHLPQDRELVAEQLWGPRQTLLRSAHYAWMQKTTGVELYDLAADPHEQTNLAPTLVSLAREGSGRIEGFRTSCEQRSRALRPPAANPAPDPERARNLRALGYVQ